MSAAVPIYTSPGLMANAVIASSVIISICLTGLAMSPLGAAGIGFMMMFLGGHAMVKAFQSGYKSNLLFCIVFFGAILFLPAGVVSVAMM